MTLVSLELAETRDAAAALGRSAEVLRRHVNHPSRAEPLGLQLNRWTATTPLGYQRYAPSLSVVLSGRKRVVIGDDDVPWGATSFLITPVDLPVVGSVTKLGEDDDFLSATWLLDPMLVAEVASQYPTHRRSERAPRLGTMTPQLADALDRLFRLLDTPEEHAVLGPLVKRELILRLLQTDQATRVLSTAGAARAELVATAIDAFSQDLTAPWTLDRVAQTMGTSPATVTRRFRQMTGMAPCGT